MLPGFPGQACTVRHQFVTFLDQPGEGAEIGGQFPNMKAMLGGFPLQARTVGLQLVAFLNSL